MRLKANHTKNKKRMNWSVLRPGDIVDLVAPGFGPTPQEIGLALKFLRQWDLVPRVTPDLLGKDVLCSNSDKKRFEFLHRALCAEDSQALWCLRGGYGSNRLLPYLHQLKPPRHNKVLIGYSDVTTLHLFLNQFWGWNTLHAPLLDRLSKGLSRKQDQKEIKDCLWGKKSTLCFQNFKPLNQLARQKKMIKASITGGNLTTWVSAVGTPWEGRAAGQILFFEDIGEPGRKIDRMLVQLEQSGGLKGVKAMLLGDFVGGAQPNGRHLWRKVLQRFAEEASFPVFHHFPSGHGSRQRTVALGPLAQLVTGPNPFLEIPVGNQLR